MATPPIRIIKFWTAYTKRDGVNVGHDMVEYCAPGQAQYATTTARVSSLARIREDVDPDNPGYMMARMRWLAIEPAYEAWKAGREIPVVGTPLAVWSGITPEQAEVVRSFGLRTVEEVAGATDTMIGKINLPGMRDLRQAALMFIEASDQNKVADALAERDSKIAALQADLEEMKTILLEAEKQVDPELNPDGSEAPRRRGRPPKVRDDANDGAIA